MERKGDLKANKKKVVKDSELESEDLEGLNFEKHELKRVYAKDLTFTKVSFKQSIIHESYFRNCNFFDCDFTGADVKSTNFQGSEFVGCTFKYTTFHSTLIGIDPLKRNLPEWENVKMQLAKNLRMNYASIGDSKGVNFAIRVELAATKEHLRKAAFSGETYYRHKKEYSGWGRTWYVIKYLWFNLLELFWGNGEQPVIMLISVPFILVLTSALAFVFGSVPFIDGTKEIFRFFVIGGDSKIVGEGIAIVIGLFRYIVIGMFVSSLVRRISRR